LLNPVRIYGAWDEGIVLDNHMLKSVFLGYDENGKENVKDKENFIKENSFFISKIDRETYEKGNEEIEDDLQKEDVGIVCDKCKNYIPIDEIIHQLES